MAPIAINISGTGRIFHEEIATYRSNIYVAWTNDTSGSGDIFFKRSVNSGKTFGDTINLSNNHGSSVTPKIAVSENHVFVAWSDNTLGSGKILFRKSVDNGTSFGGVMELSGNITHSDFPQLAVFKNSIFVVWRGCIEGSFPTCANLYFRKSSDEGSSWEKTIAISNTTRGGVLETELLISGNNIYTAWIGLSTRGGYDILFRKSQDSGLNFGNEINLSSNETQSTCECSTPRFASGANNLYVTWRGMGPTHTTDGRRSVGEMIFLRKSVDNGTSFGNIVSLSNSSMTSKPNIAASGKYLYVIWNAFSKSSTTSDIVLEISNDTGTNFGRVVSLANTSLHGYEAHIIAFNDTIYVLWTDMSTGVPSVFLKSSTDRGNTFTEPLKLNSEGSISFALKLLVSEITGEVYASWIGRADPDTNRYDLYITSNQECHYKRF